MDRSLGRAAVSVVAIGLLVGCGLDASPPPSAGDEVVDCGNEETRHGEGLSGEGRACLMESFVAGDQAVFASSAVTVEGAPISYVFRTHTEAPVVMIVDARNDPLGSGRIETYLCDRLVPVDDWNAVTGSGLPPEQVWVQDGCVPVEGG